MLKSIKVDLKAVESMLFFWSMIAEREKVSEVYILSVAETPQFRGVYVPGFDNISVRKVLSAISNREVFRSDNRKESRFWVDNIWMLEDLDYIMEMIGPIKRLHLDDMVDRLNEVVPQEVLEELHVVFVPFYYQNAVYGRDTLYVNFFRAIPDKKEERVLSIEGKSLEDFIYQGLVKILEERKEGKPLSYRDQDLRKVFY